MDYESIIFNKYLEGKADVNEKRLLLRYLKEQKEAPESLKETYREWEEQHVSDFHPYESLDHILSRISRRSFLRYSVLAAAVAAAVALFALIPTHIKNDNGASATMAELYTWPEPEKPSVLLPDGQIISSDAIEMQLACLQNSIRLDGQELPLPDSQKASCLLMVPYGHRATMRFADGSVVHLNSHSRLLFPSRFGKERKVFLNGEASFEVSRDEERQFIVDVDDIRVRVLGTRFLVSGYKGEAHKVALVSGSVNVSLGNSKAQSVNLMPNQMYTLDDNGKINVQDVPDWHSLLDWEDGVFKAHGTSMKDLLSYLSRYYGETVECDANVAGIACTGTLNLRSNLSDMLSELSGIFAIKSRKQNGVWFVSHSSE